MAQIAIPRRALMLGTALGAVAGSHAPVPANEPPFSENASVFRFRIGAFQAIAIADGQATWPAHPTYAANASPDEVRAALSAHFMDPGAYTLNFTSLLVDTGSHRLLVDTGAGSELGPTLGRLPGALAGSGIAPTSIDAVILTHAHPDHIGGIAGPDGSLAFPNAQYFLSEPDWRHWTAETLDFGGMAIPSEFESLFERAARRHLGAIRSRVTLFRPGEEILPGVSTLPLPGHTAGHSGVRIASGSSILLHVGDAFHNQAFDLDNPRWSTAFDLDPAAAFATRVRLLDQAAADRTLLMASHMPFPGLGRVRRIGDAYAFQPAPWLFDPGADLAA